MSKANEAVNCFNNGFNCSQSVFSTYSEQFGLDKETALKISCSFGGGMGRMGCTCGAVTGAFMLIGLKNGKYLPEDDAARETTYKLVQEFAERFKEKHGSIVCSDLLGCDFGTTEGRTYAREHKLFDTVCPGCVKDAALILEDMLGLD